MRIGILTGGGDTSALNAIIYGVLSKARDLGHTLIGFNRGWQGLLNPVQGHPIAYVNPNEGGTMLKTSRKKLNSKEIEQAAENLSRVDAFIGIGGDDTLSVGRELSDRLKIPTCFVTKTIDNDVGRNSPETRLNFSQIINYFTPGFPTAASRIAMYTRQLKTTAYSHERIMFLESMGRQAGWLSLSSSLADPDFILVPEVELDYEHFKEKLARRYKDKRNVVVVVSEGVRYKKANSAIGEDSSKVDEFGHKRLGGAAEILAERIGKDLDVENVNSVVPGYLYRSGEPSEKERDYSIALGRKAFDLVIKGVSKTVAVLHRNGNGLEAVAEEIDNVLPLDSSGRVIPRNLDLRFYNAEEYSITELGRGYFQPIDKEVEIIYDESGYGSGAGVQ